MPRYRTVSLQADINNIVTRKEFGSITMSAKTVESWGRGEGWGKAANESKKVPNTVQTKKAKKEKNEKM